MIEALRALGYTDGGGTAAELPDPLSPSERPSPHRRAAELRRGRQAQKLAGRGDLDEAISFLRIVLEGNPHSAFALDNITTFLAEKGEFEEAIRLLEQLLALGPERSSTHLRLAMCLGATGKEELAVLHLRRALELDPGNAQALTLLLRYLEQSGATEEAGRVRVLLEELQGS